MKSGASVIPAYAGLFVPQIYSQTTRNCYPRLRGVVRQAPRPSIPSCLLSPLTRGCSRPGLVGQGAPVVIPAYAGLFARVPLPRPSGKRYPRLRGVVRRAPGFWHKKKELSPLTRGCSQGGRIAPRILEVLPAYAGLFADVRVVCVAGRGYPRLRGVVR